jgi:hypothetical protein
MHNEELHGLYSSPKIMMTKSWTRRQAKHVVHIGETYINAYKILAENPESKRAFDIYIYIYGYIGE